MYYLQLEFSLTLVNFQGAFTFGMCRQFEWSPGVFHLTVVLYVGEKTSV